MRTKEKVIYVYKKIYKLDGRGISKYKVYRRDAKRIGSIYSTRPKRIKSMNKFMLFNFQARWTAIRG